MLHEINDNQLTILGWKGLSTISISNIFLYFYFISQPLRKGNNHYDLKSRVLSGFYVFVCAFRSILPRIDIERICLIDSWFSNILIGRSSATLAELCFIAQISLLIDELADEVYINKLNLKYRVIKVASSLMLVLISVAEFFSWLGILTTNQIFHCFEESLWLICGIISTLCFFNIFLNKEKNSNNLKLNNFFYSYFILGPIYVMYMFFVDVPMYYKRWELDQQENKQYLNILDGIEHASFCHVKTDKFSDWKEDIMWMTPYFTLCVWASLYLCRLVPKVNLKKEEKIE